jgi:5-methylcytosine-specific restriction endonuclease McrA
MLLEPTGDSGVLALFNKLRTCRFCQKTFALPGTRGCSTPYCSRECKDAYKPLLPGPGSGVARGPRLSVKECLACGVVFQPRIRKVNACGVVCAKVLAHKTRTANAYARRERQCKQCGVVFVMPTLGGKAARGEVEAGIYCSRQCSADGSRIYSTRAESRNAGKHRRRARMVDADRERFGRQEIFERDGWKCGLCGERVNRRLKYPHPRSASLDHIIPVSHGGGHTRSNTQLAHLDCNVRKGAQALGQMRLFG